MEIVKYKNIRNLNNECLSLVNSVYDKVNIYYRINDGAHQIEHALDVLNNLLHINSLLKETDNIKLLIISAMYHDIYSNKIDRSKHHILASEYVLKDKYINSILSKEDVKLVSTMILEHRASFKGERSNMLSDMMSTADLGKPEIGPKINRSIKYHNGNANGVIQHLKDKFGYNGYANYSDLYLRIYQKDIEKMQQDVEDLILGKTNIKDYLDRD